MAEYLTEIAYVGRDNTIELELTEDGVAVPVSSLTRVILDLGAHKIDSDQEPAIVFDWSGSNLVMKLGLANDIATYIGTYPARLIIYTTVQTSGIVWLDPIVIRIVGPLE